jgi:hypothetical protein
MVKTIQFGVFFYKQNWNTKKECNKKVYVLIHRLTPPFTMIGSSVAKVEKSKHKDFPEGNLLVQFCMLQCNKCNVPSGSVLTICQTAASHCLNCTLYSDSNTMVS